PRVARRLHGRSPGGELELRAAGWAAASAELVQGTVDAALMSVPFPPGFASTARFQLPVRHVAVPAGGPLATASRLGLAQLAAEEVLLPRVLPPGCLWAHGSARLPEPIRARLYDLVDLAAAYAVVVTSHAL